MLCLRSFLASIAEYRIFEERNPIVVSERLQLKRLKVAEEWPKQAQADIPTCCKCQDLMGRITNIGLS